MENIITNESTQNNNNSKAINIDPIEFFNSLDIQVDKFQDIKQETEKINISEEYTLEGEELTQRDTSESYIESTFSEYLDDITEPELPELPSPIQTDIQENEEDEDENALNLNENIKSILVKEETSRFKSADWFSSMTYKNIIIAGIGGIGSFASFFIARLSPYRIFLYDDDLVELANLSGQLYSCDSVDHYKSDVMRSFIEKMCNYNSVFSINEKFTEKTMPGSIMICGFDNMKARKTFFKSWKNNVNNTPNICKKDCLFIDGRLNAEEFQVFCIRGDDEYNINRYENEYLFEDTEADSTICSYKQTTYCSGMIGSIIANLLVNFVSNSASEDKNIGRCLPFKTYYNAPLLYLKTED